MGLLLDRLTDFEIDCLISATQKVMIAQVCITCLHAEFVGGDDILFCERRLRPNHK